MQPLLTLVAVIVEEGQVQPLAEEFRNLARRHLGHLPNDFELHGNEIWGGSNQWSTKSPGELIAVYEDAIAALGTFNVDVSHATIHKQRLHDRYNGWADGNAYLLALQFLLEKLDSYYPQSNKILIADEQKEHQLRAVKMVADMQEWRGGQVPGAKLKTVIDSMHFVSSHASPGVQLADLVAFALQRKWNQRDAHPESVSVLDRITSAINERTLTWRAAWPAV
ncbi:hypothetical protein GCM10011575_29430 [Microlunatus endophyticus]|uniref:DUF3800 domain-containing protein n=2 Tax=Microlunatus endophyticus TaxID=1716077 RepID=A0A917W521_9ACTN|nr:hypothetical protein GCM10011575_29430 [Microlunatus endophyticus]